MEMYESKQNKDAGTSGEVNGLRGGHMEATVLYCFISFHKRR